MTSTRGMARPFILLLAMAGLFGMPPVVAAHAELVRATPAAGSTVTEPVSEVTAIYSEDLTDDSRLGVLDQYGVRIAVGFVDPANKRRMVASLDQAYVAGTFTVRSTAISTDLHVEKTQWTFTVAVPATPEPTPVCTDGCNGQSTGAPPTPSPAPSPTPAPMPTASPPPGSRASSGSEVILPIIAGLAIITIGAGFLLSRGRRPPSA